MTTTSVRAQKALVIQRILLSLLIAAHGWARFLSDGVQPFGIWLDSLGFPLGLGIAYWITGLEIIGTPFLALGKLVVYLCPVYAAIYVMGIILVHAPEGWFVVGLGRNGMEYSVLLVVCLLSVTYQYLPERKRGAKA